MLRNDTNHQATDEPRIFYLLGDLLEELGQIDGWDRDPEPVELALAA